MVPPFVPRSLNVYICSECSSGGSWTLQALWMDDLNISNHLWPVPTSLGNSMLFSWKTNIVEASRRSSGLFQCIWYHCLSCASCFNKFSIQTMIVLFRWLRNPDVRVLSLLVKMSCFQCCWILSSMPTAPCSSSISGISVIGIWSRIWFGV